MAETKEKVGVLTGETSTAGRPIYKTPKGEMVSEKSTTFKYKNQWINIPTIHNGYSYEPEELSIMLDHRLIEPTSVHKNLKAAEKAAQERSPTLRAFANGGLTSHPSAMTADQYYDAESKKGVSEQTDEVLGLSSVPFPERPLDADESDRQVGGFEKDEDPIFKTILGNTYTVSRNPDQRTTRTKIEEDVIPAVKKFADDPRFPTMDEVVGAGTAVAKGAYETASIPIDLLTGKRSITDVKMQDAFDIVGGVATGSLLFPGIPAGATRMFGGTSAYNLDTSIFAKAEELLKQNVDIEDIRKETGWFLNEKDGKWRFEFDDSQMQFDTESSFKNKLNQQGKTFGQASVRLDEYINHPELFKLYPQLAEMRINPFYTFSDNSLGDYNPRSKFLRLSKNSSEKEKKATVLHEIQHAIQDIEGHGAGYNPQNVQDSIVDTDPSSIALEAKLDKAWGIVSAQNDTIEDLITPQVVDSYGTRPDGSKVALVNVFDPISQTMNQKPAWTAARKIRGKIENLIDDYKTPFGTVNKKNVLKAIKNYGSPGTNLLSKLSDKDIMKMLDKMVLKIPSKEKFLQIRKDERTNTNYVKHIYYRNAAGEIESDLVMDRMDLSMKQRRKNSPLVQAREIEKKNNSLLKPTWLQKLGLSKNRKETRLSERLTRNPELFSTREGTDKLAYDTVFRKDSQDINVPLPLNEKKLMDPLTQVYDIDVAKVAAIKPLVNWLKSKPSLEKVGNMSKGDKVNFGNGDYEFDKWEFSEVDVNTIPRGTTEFFADRTTLRTSADDKVYVPYAIFTNGGRYPIDVLLDQTPLGKTIDPTDTAGLRGNTTNVKFAQGGVAMKDQMEMSFALGGVAETVDPVSGNDVPPGSLPVEVRDDIPARLSEGEYVVPADVVRFFGVKFFEDIRMQAKMGLQQMEEDGRIGGEPVEPQQAELNDDDLNSIIEQAMQEEQPMMANEGGLAGYYNGSFVGGSLFGPQPSTEDGGDVFTAKDYKLELPKAAPVTTASAGPAYETKTFYRPDGTQVPVNFINGVPQQPIQGLSEKSPNEMDKVETYNPLEGAKLNALGQPVEEDGVTPIDMSQVGQLGFGVVDTFLKGDYERELAKNIKNKDPDKIAEQATQEIEKSNNIFNSLGRIVLGIGGTMLAGPTAGVVASEGYDTYVNSNNIANAKVSQMVLEKQFGVNAKQTRLKSKRNEPLNDEEIAWLEIEATIKTEKDTSIVSKFFNKFKVHLANAEKRYEALSSTEQRSTAEEIRTETLKNSYKNPGKLSDDTTPAHIRRAYKKYEDYVHPTDSTNGGGTEFGTQRAIDNNPNQYNNVGRSKERITARGQVMRTSGDAFNQNRADDQSAASKRAGERSAAKGGYKGPSGENLTGQAAVNQFNADRADEIRTKYNGNKKTDSNGQDSKCFLTTAVVEHRGESDDGPTLTKLRYFRDTYLVDYPEEIKKYYNVAPKIVAAIPKNNPEWDWVGTQIDSAIQDIDNNRLDKAHKTYKNMVLKLETNWLN